MSSDILSRTRFVIVMGCVTYLLATSSLVAALPGDNEKQIETDSVVSSTLLGESRNIESVYMAKCAECHGEDGQGVRGEYSAPFRAEKSIDELVKLIEETMPEDDPASCVGEEAFQLAKYIREGFLGHKGGSGSRINRMTVEQYRHAVADVIGQFPGALVLESDFEDNARGPASSSSIMPQAPGLLGEYYAGSNKSSRLGHYRSDTRLDFDFDRDSPGPTIFSGQFAINWTGGIIADHSGFYEFRLRTKNAARLYLNFDINQKGRSVRNERPRIKHKPLIDAWIGSGGTEREMTARIYLSGGQTYPVRLEFFKYFTEAEASVSLEWKPPHGTWSILDYNATTTVSPGRVFVSRTPFPADDRSQGFTQGNSISSQWQDATMNGAIEAAAEVVDRLPFLARLSADSPAKQTDSEGQVKTEVEIETEQRARVEEFVLKFASIAFRRPLTDQERSIFQDVIQLNSEQLEVNVRRAVVMVFMSPYFLYPDLTPTDEAPSSYVIASRLSFGLWDSIPDAELVRAAEKQQLGSFKEVQAQALRMMSDPRAKSKMRRFFDEWLELEYRDLSKDKELFPEFDESVIADLRRSLELFIDRVVWSRSSDYRQLLQADYLMLNKRLAALYQPPGEDSGFEKIDRKEARRRASRWQFASEFQPVDMPSDQRSGILTHPYLLSAYAYHNNTSPIHRGVFLTRNIVGRSLSPPPDAVAFNDDEFLPDLTMREKITQLTRDTACMSCHSIINPLGFTLEKFDAVGRWRETEQLNTVSDYTTVAGEELQITNARDVANIAVDSEAAHKAFITHVFQHIVKRSPSDVDPRLLDQLTGRFENDKFNIKKLWARIAAVAAIEGLADPGNLLVEKTP